MNVSTHATHTAPPYSSYDHHNFPGSLPATTNIKQIASQHVMPYHNDPRNRYRTHEPNIDISSIPPGVKPNNIWTAFKQGGQGNCVTISAIKLAMMQYGHSPYGIFKTITKTAEGFDIVMRDSFKLRLTHNELEQAKAGSAFSGDDPNVVADAVFLYAASAKRALMKNHEGTARKGFKEAMDTLNNGEVPGSALRRLGLFGKVRRTNAHDLNKGTNGTAADCDHSVAVINGHVDFYGEKIPFASSHYYGQRPTGMYLKLV